MRRFSFCITLPVVLLLFAIVTQADTRDEPYKFYREFAGLNEDQIAAIRSGKAVAKVVECLPLMKYTSSDRCTWRRLQRATSSLPLTSTRCASSLAISQSRVFSDPPQLSDLEGFTLDEQDITELKNCKTGHCQVQLPTKAIEDFQQSIDWSAPDVADRVNRLARRLALQALMEYMRGGNTALGAYRDKKYPAAVAETFASLIGRFEALPVYLPQLNQYLLEYPKAKSDNVQAGFYWEKVSFGLKPTFRIIQKIVYRGAIGKEPAYAVAEKQIYASHYFETALDLNGLRQRCATARLLHHYRQRVDSGWAYRIEREHRAQGGRRQDPFFTRAGPRDHETKTGISALAE